MLFEHQDKIHHLGAYFIMGILGWRFFNDYFEKPAMLFVISLSFCSLYGASDEVHQYYVAGREADIFDWLADTLGASLALITIQLSKKKFSTKRKAS